MLKAEDKKFQVQPNEGQQNLFYSILETIGFLCCSHMLIELKNIMQKSQKCPENSITLLENRPYSFRQ